VTAEHPKSDGPLVSVLQDASTQTDHSSDTLPSSTPNSATDQTIKAGPLPPSVMGEARELKLEEK